MTNEQLLILFILFATMAMFLWGRWRHDMVAVGSLIACTVTGLIEPSAAFSSFGHPAVITVACVLVLSRSLQISGAVDALARALLPTKSDVLPIMIALCALGTFLSAFMNNVGAMALLMPIAIQQAERLKMAPGQLLMPLAFGTILGGMMTLIGTPPNLIVSDFRSEIGIGHFGMFDFMPVGLAVAAIGVAFISLIGWRLVPARKQMGVTGFESGAYITEAHVLEDSKVVGMMLSEIEVMIKDSDVQIIGIVLKDVRIMAPNTSRIIRANDILVIEAEADSLTAILSKLGLKLVASISSTQNNQARSSGEDTLVELAVLPGSSLEGLSASDIKLRTRYSLNLLAVSRQGYRSMARLRLRTFLSGDLLLMQGAESAISEFASDYNCVPLANRELHIPNIRKAWEASVIMAMSVGAAAFNLIPTSISFSIGVLSSMALRTIPLRSVYSAIDWPVIILLGALIPVAGAIETTGAANLIAHFLIENIAQGHAVMGLLLILIVSMFLSDLMNNAATAAVMCPIAYATANSLGVNTDAFLMAVAIGASCAFLTPIGHQNNTLILGPGGFRFGDYWKLGLPLEILVIAVSVPMLLWVWPL
jgi:di/tricarboxylate transporter